MARLEPAGVGLADRRQGAQARRCRGLRIHRLPGCHRRGLRAGAGSSFSGLRFNVDFTVGYSPERINPGDKQRRLPDIVKVTSGSTPEAAAFVDALYREVVPAGTHLAPSIRVAEASKAIENTQRDVNIALVNEFAQLFGRLGIDTEAVLRAAGTKWNFLKFWPGLVGGHCIGVDPYYLVHKAQEVGYHPELILAARRINEGMSSYVTGEVLKLMARKRLNIVGARILILGVTFKENCADLRNTRVVEIVRALQSYHADVDVHDPWANAEDCRHEYGVDLVARPLPASYDLVLLAVAHHQFAQWGCERPARLPEARRPVVRPQVPRTRRHRRCAALTPPRFSPSLPCRAELAPLPLPLPLPLPM